MNPKDIAARLGSAATSLAGLASLKVDAILARTRKDLLEAAACLDLEGVSKLTKEQLARRILAALKEQATRAAKRPAKVAAKGAKVAVQGAKVAAEGAAKGAKAASAGAKVAVKGVKVAAKGAKAAASGAKAAVKGATAAAQEAKAVVRVAAEAVKSAALAKVAPAAKVAAPKPAKPAARPAPAPKVAKPPVPKPAKPPAAKSEPVPKSVPAAKAVAKVVIPVKKDPKREEPTPAAGKPNPTPGKPPPAPGKQSPAGNPGDARGAEARALAAGEDPSGTAKLDLGPAGKARKPVAHIPWGYDQDRVAAAAVDPDRLFVHWEVTDGAIDRARASLGPDGAGAWLALRVYDTSGLLFDGRNAHAWFDQGIDRSDRQWFFEIGKPTSTAHVEVGMRAPDGRFARISRSRRVDFPRREQAPWSPPEWLTVIPATGERRPAGTGLPGHDAGAAAGGEPSAGPAGPAGRGAAPAGGHPTQAELVPVAIRILHEEGVDRDAFVAQLREAGWERVEWREVEGEGFFEVQGRAEWVAPLTRTTWEAGPFSDPVEIAPPAREEWHGAAVALRVGGVTHVVHGPWQVVIRNLGAHREHAVLGRWEVYRSWDAAEGTTVPAGAAGPGPGPGTAAAPGASEHVGGSELRWMRGSELRLMGASEVWRLGASELRLRGASELLFRGASEWRIGGASERILGGASEVRLGGASELRLGGASEARLGGASDGRLLPSPYPKIED